MLKEKDFNSIRSLSVNSWEQYVKLYTTARASYKCAWYYSSKFRTFYSRRAARVCHWAAIQILRGNNTTNTIFYEHAAAQASLYTQSKRLNSWFKVLKTIADRTNKPVISRLVGDLSVELSRAQDILSEKPVDLERLKQINKESTYTYTFTLTS